MTPPRVVLLGPQFHQPTAGAALAELGEHGPVATITAGWQEREADDEALDRQLGGRSVSLQLYERAHRVWEADPELFAEHQAMQTDLRLLRKLYNRQLEPAADAWVGLMETEGPQRLVAPEREEALAAIQRLDAHLLHRTVSIRGDFEARVGLLDRPSVAAEREQIADALDGVSAVVIEGGHIAVLLNRIALFGVANLLAGKTLVGCAGGAMALCRRVVLYDDSPAIGRGHAEVALPGLGLAPGVVALPDAVSRLRADDPRRMQRLALRLTPEACALLDPGARLVWDGDAWAGHQTSLVLPDGTLRDWEAAA